LSLHFSNYWKVLTVRYTLSNIMEELGFILTNFSTQAYTWMHDGKDVTP